MRTTVTLDADVAEQLKRQAREHGRSFKSVLNDAIRAGLASERGRTSPYRVPARRLGLRHGVDLTKALDLAASLEDEEIARKLELRK